MARTIESPGVEIREIDLSLRTALPVGTKVLVHGFASQGPTNELIQVSTKDELDQVFFGGGGPTNAAERYFYSSCREILNSPATMLVTRLPYGSGDGTGFSGEYVALAYPATANASVTIAASAIGTVSSAKVTAYNEIFNAYSLPAQVFPNSVSFTITRTLSSGAAVTPSTITVIDNGVGALFNTQTNPSVSGSINYTTGDFYLSGYWETSPANQFVSQLVANYQYLNTSNYQFNQTNYLTLGAPYVVPLTESEYMDIKSGQITWSTAGGACSSVDTLGNAAFLVVNDAKTTIDEKYEGYYVALADNSVIAAAGYDCVTQVKTLSSDNSLRVLSPNLLGFSLTGTDVINPGNISEVIETGYNYDFSNITYNNAVVMYLFRLRTSVYAPDADKLYYVPVENYIGSLASNDQRANSVNGQMDSFYLADKVNNLSNYVQMFVNTNIANQAALSYLRNGDTTLNPIGSYTPCKAIDTSLKYIGSIPSKIERALVLAESVQSLDVDITVGAGLETIWAYVADEDGVQTYDDTANVAVRLSELADVNVGDQSLFAGYHRTIFNLYNTFCSTTRKDCVHYSDPIRGIFIQGEKSKTLDRKDRNFTSNILVPLRNLYSSANSNYSATYANWVSIYDNNTSKFIWMPFSGWQAAITARMDANLQPWYAPFGLNNGLIPNITDIALRTNQKQQDALYRIGINPVVFFQGDGFVVWGQKTLQAKPSAFDRLNVRRLFLTLERATLKIMRYFVGEPNTIFTRTRVSNVLKPIFDLAKNNEGCYDYLIVCDERNNTPTVIDNNEMKVDIYIKPVRTAEFILVTFYCTRTDQDFNELVG